MTWRKILKHQSQDFHLGIGVLVSYLFKLLKSTLILTKLFQFAQSTNYKLTQSTLTPGKHCFVNCQLG